VVVEGAFATRPHIKEHAFDCVGAEFMQTVWSFVVLNAFRYELVDVPFLDEIRQPLV
jgi:hypothetical protein